MSYKSTVRDEDNAIAEDRLPCRYCGKPTLRETLTQYGARCFRCYEDYLAKALSERVDVGDQRKSLKSWAHALKRRHESGEPLSRYQITAYQEALKPVGQMPIE
jgi:hypothetical protein